MISFMDVNKFILSGVSIHIPKGRSVGIIGETGSGKTTFLKLVCGLLKPESGEVYTMGRNAVAAQKELTGRLGVLFAGLPILQAEESVEDNLENRRVMYRIPQEEYRRQYAKLAVALGFGAFAKEKVRALSLGQRRRAELGAVFLHQPELLLLDEPTVGLDQSGKDAVRELITEREQQGLTTLVTSHDMLDIASTCSRVVLLHKGTICAYGNQELILKKYAPVDVMQLTIREGVPDLEDLPVHSYSADGDCWRLIYNSNYVTAAEVLRTVLAHCSIDEVSIRKPDLGDVIVHVAKRSSENVSQLLKYRSKERE